MKIMLTLTLNMAINARAQQEPTVTGFEMLYDAQGEKILNIQGEEIWVIQTL